MAARSGATSWFGVRLRTCGGRLPPGDQKATAPHNKPDALCRGPRIAGDDPAPHHPTQRPHDSDDSEKGRQLRRHSRAIPKCEAHPDQHDRYPGEAALEELLDPPLGLRYLRVPIPFRHDEIPPVFHLATPDETMEHKRI